MASETGDSSGNVDVLLNALSIHIGASGDSWGPSAGDSTLYGLYNYMVGCDGSETDLTDALVITHDIGASLNTILTERHLNLGTIQGGTYSTSESDFTLSRKWRLFWVKARIGKPNSTLLGYTALGTAVTDANNKITDANTQLQTLMGNDLAAHLAYIPTPTLLTAYFNPKRDQDTGEILTRKIYAVYDGQQHASEYWIYRQIVPAYGASNIANTQWNSSSVYNKYGDTDDESGFIKKVYIDWDATFDVGDKYVYRVRTMDYVNTVSGDTTASDQSNIFDSTKGKSFTSIIGDSILNFGDSHDFKKNNYVVVNDLTSSNGYYTITRVEDTRIYVSPSILLESGSGNVYPCSCVVFIED